MSTRAIAIAALLIAVTVACGDNASQVTPEDSGGKYGSGVDLNALDGETAAPPTSGARAPITDPGNGPAPTRDTLTVEKANFDLTDDDSTAGRNALPLLRGTRYKKLVIEFSAVRGWHPDPEALSILKSRLGTVLDKPAGIEFLPPKTFASSRNEYSREDFPEFEKRYRTRFSDANADVVVIHALYLNGEVRDLPLLGEAYRASSIVIMPERIERLSSLLVTRGQIEGAVLIHEVGHLLRLVNIGYKSPRDHADPKTHIHSKNPNSVMYPGIDGSSSFVGLFDSPPPTEFDRDDLADLADIKAGRLGPR